MAGKLRDPCVRSEASSVHCFCSHLKIVSESPKKARQTLLYYTYHFNWLPNESFGSWRVVLLLDRATAKPKDVSVRFLCFPQLNVLVVGGPLYLEAPALKCASFFQQKVKMSSNELN